MINKLLVLAQIFFCLIRPETLGSPWLFIISHSYVMRPHIFLCLQNMSQSLPLLNPLPHWSASCHHLALGLEHSCRQASRLRLTNTPTPVQPQSALRRAVSCSVRASAIPSANPQPSFVLHTLEEGSVFTVTWEPVSNLDHCFKHTGLWSGQNPSCPSLHISLFHLDSCEIVMAI